MGYYISCRYILLQKKLDLKVVKLYSLHSQGSFVFVHSIRIISLKMSDSTKERFYFIQNKFIWSYFYTIGDYNKYLNTIRRLIGRCNRYFGRWLYFNPSGFRYDPRFRMIHKIWHKKEPIQLYRLFFMSGYQDSNLGPPAPKAGALTGLRYTPFLQSLYFRLRCKGRYLFLTTKYFIVFFICVHSHQFRRSLQQYVYPLY